MKKYYCTRILIFINQLLKVLIYSVKFFALRKYPSFAIIVVSATLFICGVSLVRLLNMQLSPSGRTASFSNSFAWPNTGARVVEQEVSSKLEALCASVQGVSDISSRSNNGGGEISLGVDKKADVDAIRCQKLRVKSVRL